MKLPMRSWTRLLDQISPDTRRRRRAKKKQRRSAMESLEPRQMLTVTVLDGSTTLYNDPSGSGSPSDDFGSTPMGTPVDKVFTIQNTASTDVTLTAGSLNLPNGFSLVGSFPTDVAADGTATFTVEMGATSIENPNGELSFGYNDSSAETYQFAISGTVNPPPPALTVQDGATLLDNGSGSDDFGTTTMGTPVQKTFTIENAAGYDVNFLGNPSLPDGFSLVASFPTSVAANSSTTFTVQMDASSINSPSGALNISDDDPGSGYYSFTISGMVNPPPPALTVQDGATLLDNGSGSDDFGSTTMGTPIQKTFTVYNSSSNDISLYGPPTLPNGFSIGSGGFPGDVPPNSSATFVIQMDAASIGDPSGTFSFSDGDPGGGSYSFTISGMVNPPPPALTVQDGVALLDNGSGSDDFGSTTMGTPIQKTFTVYNSSSNDISLYSPPTLPDGFSIGSGGFPGDVPPNSSTTFVIQMDAGSIGDPSGTFSFSDGDPGGGSYSFTISGMVNPPPPALTVQDGVALLDNGSGSDDFGSTTMGTPIQKTFTIENSAGYDVNFYGNPSLPDGFSLVGSFPASVAANSSTTFTVQMDASSVNSPSGTLNLSDDDPGSGYYSFTISGMVNPPPPAITVQDGATLLDNGSGSDDFGSTTMGTPIQKTFTIENAAGYDVNFFGNPSLPDGFSLVGSFPTSVAANSSTTFTVQMDASSINSPSGTLNLSDDDPGSGYYSFTISGMVNPPPPALTVQDGATLLDNGSGSDDFGSTTMGTPIQKTFTVYNSSSNDISLYGSPTLPNGFSIGSGGFPGDVPPNSSTTFVIQLDAASMDIPSGTFSFSDSDPGSGYYSFTVSGMVTMPPPAITVQDGAMLLDNGSGNDDFGSTTMGAPIQKTFTVYNSSSNDISLYGPPTLPSGFSLVDGAFPATVPADGSATFAVQMDAATLGYSSGAFSFSDGDPGGGSYSFMIDGTVNQPSEAISVWDGSSEWYNDPSGTGSPRDDFGTTVVGTPLQKTFTIQNSSSSDIALTAGSLSLPNGFSLVDTTFPTTVPANGSTTFTVQLDASAAGSPNGELSFSDNDPGGGAYQFAIGGTVNSPPPVLSVWDGSTEWNNDPAGTGSPRDDFGTTVMGTPLQKTFTIQNSGSSDIALTAGSLNLPNGFSLVDTFPTTVPANGSTTFTVQLDASAAGYPNGELSFSDADPGGGGAYQFAIGGTVNRPPPVITVLDGGTTIPNDPSNSGVGNDNFGITTLGEPIDKVFTIANSGAADIALTAGSLALPAGFSLVGSFPTTVPAGGSTTFTVQLDAASVGYPNGDLSFTDDDPGGGAYQFTVRGQVNLPPPVITVLDSGTTIPNDPGHSGVGNDNFGITTLGEPIEKVFTIANSGAADIALTAGSLALPAGFSLVGSFPTTVPAGGSTTFTVQLDAASVGYPNGDLSFTDDDPGGGAYQFTVRGQVNLPPPVITVLDSGTTIPNDPGHSGVGNDNFGITTLGEPIEKVFTIANSGAADIALTAGSLALPAGFSLVGSFPTTVPAGGSTTFTVQLDAAAVGYPNGDLSFADDDPGGGAYQFTIRGQVNLPPPVITVLDGDTTITNDPGNSGVGNDNFGITTLGEPIEKVFTIANSGSADIALTAGSLALPAGFSLVGSFPTTVPAGGSTTFTVQLDAASVGYPNGDLSFTDDDPGGGAYQFTVRGQVNLPPPVITVLDSGTTIPNDPGHSGVGNDNFGITTLGEPIEKVFTIANSGSADIALTAGSLALPAGFSLVGSFPTTVPAGGSTTFTVQLDAASVGYPNGDLSFTDDDPGGGAYQFTVRGQVNLPPPVITVLDSGTTIPNDPGHSGVGNDNFGITTLGEPIEKVFTIANSGAADIALTAGSLALPSGFSLVGSFPTTVPANGSTTFTVQMDATSVGYPNGDLSFTDDDPGGGAYQFTIRGQVNLPPPVITVLDSGTTIPNDPSNSGVGNDDFGITTMGIPIDKTFTIANSGAADITLTAGSLALPAGFSLVGSFPTTVPAGGSTTFTVQLDAAAVGYPNGDLSFADDDPGGGAYQFTIRGQVNLPPPVITVLDGDTTITNDPGNSGVGNDDFGVTTMGIPLDKTFTIANSGSADIALTAGSLTLPAGFSLVGSFPTTVPANGSTTFTVQMDAAAIGYPNGDLSFADDDPGGGAYQFTIRAQVNPPPPVITVLDGDTTIANDPYDSGTSSDDLGSTPMGTPLDKTFTIANSGASDIALTADSLHLPAGFSLVGSFPTSVPAGGSTTFTVEFLADSPGGSIGEMSFSDSDPGGSFYQFIIRAEATTPYIELYDQGSWLTNGIATDSFGETEPGVPVQKTFTIENAGQAPLTLTPTSLVVPTGFSLIGALPTSVAVGDSATFTIQLDAAAGGTFTGSLAFLDNDPFNNPFSITLTGVVDAPAGQISVTDAGVPVIDGQSQLDFGSTDAGTPLLQTLLIKNTGTASLTLDSQTLLLPAGFSVAQAFDASVAPGASTNLTLELNSAQGGDFSGLASFGTGDPGHPTFSFYVSGYVTPPAPVLQVLAGATTYANGASDGFGSTSLGAPLEQTFTLENHGNATLDLDTHSLSLPDGFSVVTPFSASVAPGASTTLVVRLDAATGGEYSGAMNFSSDDPINGDFSLELSGMVLAPAIAVSFAGAALTNNQGEVDFGSTPLGVPVSETISIQNTGAADLSLDPASLSLPSGYSLASGFASELAPGASTTLTVQLNATATGTISGQIQFSDGDPNNSPFAFAVTGLVTAPRIAVSDDGTTLASGANDNFGSTTVGAPVQRTLTIENTGQAPLTLDASSLVLPTGFSLVTPFVDTVPAGGSTTLVVELDAPAASVDSGLLSFSDNDPLTPVYKLHLFGQVQAPALQVRQAGTLLASGSSVSLGATPQGTPLQLSLVIGNDGTGALALDAGSLSLPAGFSVVHAFADSVAPASGTTLVVQLDAAAAGDYSGTLSFTSNDTSQSPFQLTLSGSVTAPAVSVLDGATAVDDQGSEDLGLTPIGTPIQKTLTVENTGTAPLAIDTANISLPAGFSLTSAPDATIAPGDSSTLTIQLDASATGDYSGLFSLPTNDPNQPDYAFTLSGRVLLTAATLEVFDGSTTLSNGDNVTFADTQTGMPESKTLTIENQGYPALSLDAASLSLPAGYSVAAPLPDSVPGGGSTTLTVQLDASTAGSYSGALEFTSGDSANSPFSLELAGTVTAPAARMVVLDGTSTLVSGASSVPFPDGLVGSPETKTLTIENTGAGTLTIDTASIQVPSGFTVISAPAASVAPGGSTTIELQLDAAAAGNYSGTLEITDNDANQATFSVTLSGDVSVPAPALTVKQGATVLTSGSSTVTLPAAVTGSPTTATLTIENTGTAELDLDSGSLTLPAGFSVATAFASTVAPGASTSLVLQLDATTAGSYSGTLSFASNEASQSTFSLSLSGEVSAAAPDISLVDVLGGGQIADGGAIDLGDTPRYKPTYELLGIKNTGTGALSLDPASLTLPAGFSVFQAFDASVAAGGETYLAIEFNADDAGAFSGTASFGYSTDPNAPESTYSFTLSATATAPPPSGIVLEDVALADNIGPRSALAAADPTVSGTVYGTFNGGSVVVQFDASGDGTADGATDPVTASGGGFSFDPRSVDAALVGYTGPVDLKYRAEILDAAGNATYGDWTDFAFTMVAAPTTAHVDDLALANDTGASNSDQLTYDPRVSGQVGGPFAGTTVDVQFVVGDGAGDPSGALPVDPVITGSVTDLTVAGQSFTYNPADDDPALVNYAGAVTLSYRTVEYDADGNVVDSGAWASLSYTLYAPTPQASVSGFHLIDDSGSSNTDLVTDDPRVAGTVTGTFTNEIVGVQFSNQGDGEVDGQEMVLAAGNDFSYDPRQSDPSLASYSGTLNLAYRTVEFDPHGGEIYSAWVSFPITLTPQTTSAIIDNLHLVNVSGSAGPPPVSDDPSVAGTVVGAQTTGAPQVQFDYNGDGTADETVDAGSDGTFTDSLPGLAYGDVSLQARVVEYDSTSGVYLYGAWTTLEFDYVPAPPASIASLSLVNVTDADTGGTSDPGVHGVLASDASGQLVEVQFDTNGDGQADGQTLTDTQGNFSFTPLGLSYGSVTIAARAVAHGTGPLTYSPWFSLTFTYEAPPAEAPSVKDFRLAHDDGLSSTDNVTTDPTVTGTVFYDQLSTDGGQTSGQPTIGSITSQSVQFLTVEFDANGDGTADASTTTGAGGTFTYRPAGLAYGQTTIAARAVGRDSQDNKIYGDWVSLTFTYNQPASDVAAVSSLVLTDPTSGAGSTVTTDPSVSGQLTKAGDSSATAVSFLTVEIDTNGDGTPDATVMADATGKFSYLPSGLAYGSVTLAARARQHDYATGGFDYGAWTTLAFTYQAPAGVTAPSIASLSLLDDSGTSASDGATSNATLKGSVSGGDGGALLVEIDSNGDGAPDGYAWPDGNGNFTYAPTGLAYGPVTIAARAEVWDPKASSYVAGDWTTLSFTYQQQTEAAPQIAAWGLIGADGALDTQVSSDTTTSAPVVGGQLTFQGAVAGLTIEIDTGGDGTPDATVTTDQYGDFSYAPAGLTPGAVTINIRAVALDGTTKAPLKGAWTPLTFTYAAPTAPKPQITALALVDDTGASNTDKITTDPALTGTATGVHAGATLVIQFDTNGDGTPDGTTTADASGNFNWTPAGLAAGQLTIAARAVDQDAAGNPIYGDWTSLTFTLQSAAAPSPTLIGSLALVHNVGPSASALVSVDGAITGQVAAAAGSGAGAAGVTVQIDLNGDGTPEATVTTDANGNFTYTPAAGSLPAPTAKIAVRTADQATAASNAAGTSAGATTSSAGVGTMTRGAAGGYWTTLSFILSSNPSSADVQSQAQTLADNVAAAAQAAGDSQSTSAAAQATLSDAETTAAATYNAALAEANDAAQASQSSASAAYNSAVSSAQSAYQDAMNQAANDYQAELASFGGDTTSYAYQPYAWPDAPPALPPPDETPATSPVAAPTFDGPQFDPMQDPAYAAAIADDLAAYNTGVEEANDGYATAVEQAVQQRDPKLESAREIEQQDFAEADSTYEAAMSEANPTDVTGPAEQMAADIQQAENDYHDSFLKANAKYLGKINDAYGVYQTTIAPAFAAHDSAYHKADAQLETDLESISGTTLDPSDPGYNAAYGLELKQIADAYHKQLSAYADADLAFSLVVDGAEKVFAKKADGARAEHDSSAADALFKETKAIDAAQVPYSKAVHKAADWEAVHKADAERDRQLAYDLAEKNYGVSLAQAAQSYSDALAVAAHTRDDQIADALETQRSDDATALDEAAQGYAESVGTPWAGEQAALAEDQAQYDSSDATAQHTMAYSEDQAAYDDAIVVDEANESRDETIAKDQQDEQDSQAKAQRELDKGQADNDQGRADSDTGYWQTFHDAWAKADHAFNLSAIGDTQTYADAEADAGTDYVDAEITAEHDFIVSGIVDMSLTLEGDQQLYDQEMNAAGRAYALASAGAHKDYVYSLAGDFSTEASGWADAELSYSNSVSDRWTDWSKQNDTLAGTDESAIGSALADQDKFDVQARDDADITAANQAAAEATTDAEAQQVYNDADAGFAETQDVNDAEAEQTFELTVADDYATAMQDWAQTAGNPSATEQAAEATADAAWVLSVTTAELDDIEHVDAADVAWAVQVDAAAEAQQADDAGTIAGAIVASDTADAQRAADRDGAWKTEAGALATDTTTYDQAEADSTNKFAKANATAAHGAHAAADQAYVDYMKAVADAQYKFTDSGDADQYGADLQAALTALKAKQAQVVEDFSNAWAGAAQTYVNEVSDKKATWVDDATGDEADYVAAAATADATETASDAGAVAAMDGTLAGDEAAFEIALEDQNVLLDGTQGSEEEALVHGEAEADAADEVAYGQAAADYSYAVWNNYAQQLAATASALAAASPNPTADPAVALANYYAAVAQDNADQVSADGTELVSEEQQITAEEVWLGDQTEAASVDETNADDAAVQEEMLTLLPEEVQAVEDSDAALAASLGEDAEAQAAYQTGAARAIAASYVDAADATRDYDQAMAKATVAWEASVAASQKAYATGQETFPELEADNNAAGAKLNDDLQTALKIEQTAYAEAEVTEAESIGGAQVTLATAQGADEVELATAEAEVADTLAGQTTTAEETLGSTISAENAGTAETVAGDQSDATTVEGGEEIDAQQQLGVEEVTAATNLATAQADYAIAMAQAQAAAAAAFAAANPSDATTFQSLYAQGYVTWLTDLKPAFIASAAGVAQASAQNEQDLLAADVDLADQEAQDNVDFVTSEAPESAAESDAIQVEADGYQVATTANVGQDQIGTAEADQTQMLDLAEAASAYLVNAAKADKNEELNIINNVSNWKDLYKQDIADAKLTLTDEQADADQAWIEGKATADDTFLIADAGAWQTMSDDEAGTTDLFANQDDADVWAENDAVAKNESDALKAEALADQKQGNSDAAAAASFQIAQANETATIWSWLDGQLGTPWADSQAGLAATEATWAVTAAANYQTYIAGLGTAEINYANDNAARFLTEIKAIDLADLTAGNDAADAAALLSTTLTDDEASFEEADAPAGMGYQDAVGQAQDAYRKAKAQADHDLAIGGTQAAYDAEMAAAEEARTAGYDLAYEDFATLVAPLITTQGLGDAAAELLDAQTVAGSSLTDITDNNQAVDGYQDAESTDYDGEQRADAQALDDYNVANANGHAAAIAAFAQANPSPWADLASATAAAEAAQQLAQALAQLTQSNAQDDAQMYQEQAQDDALEGEDNALAQAESDQATTDALAQDGAATAAAENPDAVFEDLPDTLIAPAEGPTPTLTPDRYYIYQTGDPALYAYETPFAGMVLADGLTGGSGGIAGSASGPWTEPYFGAPNFMPDDLGVPGFAYDWQGYGQQIPFGLLGTFTVSSGSAEFQGATSIIEGDGVGIGDGFIGIPELDLVRTDQRTAGHPSLPISAISDTRVHFGVDASLLNVANTPSAIGVGGYSQSQIPTSPQALLLASTGTTSEETQMSSYTTLGATQPDSTTSSGGTSTGQSGGSFVGSSFGDALNGMSASELTQFVPLPDLPPLEAMARDRAESEAEIIAKYEREQTEAKGKEILRWMMENATGAGGDAPTAVGPDGVRRPLLINLDGKLFTWAQDDDGRWRIQMLVRPENVTPDEWAEYDAELWNAASYRDPTPIEQAAINELLLAHTETARENWLAGKIPDSLLKQMQQDAAIAGAFSPMAEDLIALEKMIKDPNVSNTEIINYGVKASAWNATINTLFSAFGMVIGPAVKKLGASAAIKHLLAKGDEVATQVMSKIDDLSKLLNKGGGAHSLSKAEQGAARHYLDDLAKLANSEKLDQAAAQDVRAALKELEEAFATSNSAASRRLQKAFEHVERAGDSMSARRRAAELAGLGDDSVPLVSDVGPQKGWIVGRQSRDGLRGWRVDWDPGKGFHINWWDHTGGPKRKDWFYGAIQIEGGTWDAYIELLKHGFGN